MKIELKSQKFQARDLARITGISTAMQSQLRHRGYSPRNAKQHWNDFEVHDLAALILRGDLFKLGIPPRVTEYPALVGAQQVYQWTLLDPSTRHDPKGLVKRVRPPRPPARFMIFYGKTREACAFEHDLSKFYNRLPEGASSATIVIDLREAARRIVRGARQPLWTVVEAKAKP